MDKTFRLILKQNNDVISSMEFPTFEYSSKTLSSIDVRSVLSNIFKVLNNMSSKKTYDHKYLNYNLLTYYQNLKKHYPDAEDFLKDPEMREITIRDKKIKGVEMTLIFYINNEIIFDRNVYVYNYNPKFRFSNELNEFMNMVKSDLLYVIKATDIYNIYNENKEHLNVTTSV